MASNWNALTLAQKIKRFESVYKALPKPRVVCPDTSFLGIRVPGFTEVRLSRNITLQRSHVGYSFDMTSPEFVGYAQTAHSVPSNARIAPDETIEPNEPGEPGEPGEHNGNLLENTDAHDDDSDCIWIGPEDLEQDFENGHFALPKWLLEECDCLNPQCT